jgi:hypothetical protein
MQNDEPEEIRRQVRNSIELMRLSRQQNWAAVRLYEQTQSRVKSSQRLVERSDQLLDDLVSVLNGPRRSDP